MTEDTRAGMRNGIEGVVTAAEAGAHVRCWGGSLFADPPPGERLVIRPLPAVRQLALSVLVGEPVPPVVLLAALEDAGIYPNGVLAAAEESGDAPLDFGTPVYTPTEPWGESHLRFRKFGPWLRGQKAQVVGLCLGLLGRQDPEIGTMYTDFIDAWLGKRLEGREGLSGTWPPEWPTDEDLRQRIARLPPLGRVFRHLRQTAHPTTAAVLTRLIEYLEFR